MDNYILPFDDYFQKDNQISMCHNRDMFRNPYYVYIIEGSDGKFYTGFTVSIRRRLNEHNGRGRWKNPRAWTFKRMPMFLVHLEKHSNKKSARIRELELKEFSHEKKKTLISKTTKGDILSAI
jgi:putative endonuclease